MSKIWKGINKFFIKLLNFSYNNVWFKLSILGTGIVYLVLLHFYPNNTLFKAWNLSYALLTTMYIFGWSYDTDKKNERIAELEWQLNEDKLLVSEEDIKEDLADLMHEIWANDIFSNKSNSNEKQLERAEQAYYYLSDSDKEVNREKADKVIRRLEEYKVI